MFAESTVDGKRILSCDHYQSLERLTFNELSNREFRLLLVHEHDDEHKFHCSLHTFSLDDAPPYVAISYTWAPSAKENEPSYKLEYNVICDGYLLSVSGNLFDALCRVSKRYQALQDDEYCYVWADAICINQDNPTEKASQVAMMGSVYANASLVYVWLGEHDAADSTAFELIETFFTALDAAIAEDRVPHNFTVLCKDTGIWEKIRLDRWEEAEGIAVVSLLTKKWFARAWILQEVAVAKDIIVVCGELAMHWSTLEMISNFMFYSGAADRLINIQRKVLENKVQTADQNEHGLYQDNAYPIGTLPMRIFKLRGLCESQRAKSRPSSVANENSVEFKVEKKEFYEFLVRLILFFRPSHAVKAKDKIFAPLAIVNYIFQAERFPDRQLFPNYRTSPSQTYIQACRMVIEHTQNLEILSQVEDYSSRNLQDLPSWVPDTSVTGFAQQIDQKTSGELMAKSVFRADHGFETNSIPKVLEVTRSVASVLWDTIENAGPGAPDSHFDNCPAFWFQLILELPEPYHNGQSRAEVLWRTMICDQESNKTPAPRYLGGAFYAFCLKTLPKSEHLRMATEQAAEAGNVLASWIELDELAEHSPPNSIPRFTDVVDFMQAEEDDQHLVMVEHLADRFSRLHGRVIPTRRLFTSAKKACGICPMSAREGDKITFFAGANVPFIIRRLLSGEYCLVGECYLHGFMQGEAFRGGNVREETIMLV